jgi:hypothetical protein
MTAQRSNEHLTLFSRIDDEARQAFCQGDLGLSDLIGDTSELSLSCRDRLVRLLKDWGRRNLETE